MCTKSFEPSALRVAARIKLFVLARDYFIVAMVAMVSMCGVGYSYADPTLGFRIRRDDTATSVIRMNSLLHAR